MCACRCVGVWVCVGVCVCACRCAGVCRGVGVCVQVCGCTQTHIVCDESFVSLARLCARTRWTWVGGYPETTSISRLI